MSSEEYRQNAADCLKLAQSLTDPAGKAGLLEMAQGWIRLAEQVASNRLGRQEGGPGRFDRVSMSVERATERRGSK